MTSTLPTIRLKQSRGSWIASPVTSMDRAVLSCDEIPVFRYFKDDVCWLWNRDLIQYSSNMNSTKDGAWWCKVRFSKWRMLLLNRSLVAIRYGTGKLTLSDHGSVGKYIGVFSIGNALINDKEIKVRFLEKIAEVK